MASPVVAGRNESATTTAGTSHVVSLPGSIAAGDKLVIGLAGASSLGNLTASGWTQTTGSGTTMRTMHRVADGSEGATVTVTSSLSTRSAHVSYRITGAEDFATQAPEIQNAGGTSTTPDPPSNSPTGGSKDYLFLAMFRQEGEEADDDTWCNSAPTNYTNLLQKTCGTAGSAAANCSIASAERQVTTATEDPGTFSVDQSLAWTALTIAIHPPAAAGPQDVSPGAQSMTLTPVAPTVKQQVSAPAAQAMTLTPVAPSQVSQQVNPAAQAMTLTPVAPASILVPQSVSPAAQAMTLTPVSPEVRQQVNPAAIAMTLAPVAPSQIQQQVALAAQAMTLTPVAPTVNAGAGVQQVEPAAQSMTLTPVAPTVNQLVSVAAQAMTLAPVAPSVRQQLNPVALAMTLAPVAPTVKQQVNIGLQSMTLTPVSPAIVQQVRPAALSMTITPVAPSQVREQVNPAAQAMTLIPVAPVIQQVVSAQQVAVGTIAMTMTPLAPSVYFQLAHHQPVVVGRGDMFPGTGINRRRPHIRRR